MKKIFILAIILPICSCSKSNEEEIITNDNNENVVDLNNELDLENNIDFYKIIFISLIFIFISFIIFE